MLDVQENYIEKIEPKPEKDGTKGKGILKNLIN
jgi:hypothetical protein